MKTKTHTLLPSESSEENPGPKPKSTLPEPMGKKEGAPRNWRDGSMVGTRFGKLTVVGPGLPDPRNPRQTLVPLRCDCGAKKQVTSTNLRHAGTCSACTTERMRKRFQTHGCLPKDVFRIWTLMHNRCKNPKTDRWAFYGGRGIKVCERWNSFEAFRDDMGPRPSPKHSIDRIDNEKGYSPDNCRWATTKEQCRNRRTSRWLTVQGQTKTLAEWAEQSPVSRSVIYFRLRSGWNPEAAIFTPKTH